MLKHILLLMAYFAFTTGFKVNLTRTYFYINKNEGQNTYLRASKINQEVVMDTQDITVTWINKFASWKNQRLKLDFYIHYNGKYASQITRFEICAEDFHHKGLHALAQTFFDYFIANYKKDMRCPIEGGTTSVSKGHLAFSRGRANSIYCNTLATVHLLIYENIRRYTKYGQQYDDQYKIWEVAYKGMFTEC